MRSYLLCQWFSRDVFYYLARKETRQQFAAIPSLIKNRKFLSGTGLPVSVERWWYFLKRISQRTRGRNVSNRTDLRAMLSGLLCDRVGIGVDEKKYFPLIASSVHYLRLLLRFLLCHAVAFYLFHLTCHSSVLSWFVAGWQPAGNAKVAEATGSMLFQSPGISSLDFVF